MITQQNTTLHDILIENPKKYKNLTIFPIVGRNYSNNCSVFHDAINDDSLEISEISNEITEHLEYKVNKINDEDGSISLAWEKVDINFNFKVKE